MSLSSWFTFGRGAKRNADDIRPDQSTRLEVQCPKIFDGALTAAEGVGGHVGHMPATGDNTRIPRPTRQTTAAVAVRIA